MSHTIYYRSYPANCNKAEVEESWDRIVQHEDYQEGASGLPNSIRWIDKTLNSYDEAKNYIDTHDKGWYDCLAVKYLDFSNIKPSKKIGELETRLNSCHEAYWFKNNAFHFENAKAEFIGCKNCGSKIARKHLNGNSCPVCRGDLRPESTLKAIQAAKTAVDKARAALDAERKKYNAKCHSKAKIRWLVKVEYHT